MNDLERVARAICAVEWGNPDHPLKQLQPGDPTVAWEIYVPEATAAIAAMRGEPVAWMYTARDGRTWLYPQRLPAPKWGHEHTETALYAGPTPPDSGKD